LFYQNCVKVFDRHFVALCRAAAYITSILVAAPFLYHLAHGSSAYLGLFEDDYFYYATVADKFVTLGKLTYDGSILTNGFHPLWFVVVALLRAVCGRFGTTFYVALTLISIASMILTYELTRRFALALGASPRWSAGIAVIYSYCTAQLLSTGMECVLAVPLFLWLLIEAAETTAITPRRAAKLGLIASLAILARIDIAIAVAMLIVGFVVLVRPPLASLARILAAFGLGGALLPAYALANYLFFGSPLPMSAVAKRLLTSQGFSLNYARHVALLSVYGPTMSILLPLGLVALLLIIRRDPRNWSAPRFVGAVSLIFAFAFFGFNALTGWTFFGWYAFPFAPAIVASIVFISENRVPYLNGLRVRALALAIIIIVPIVGLQYYIQHGPRWTISDNSLLAMSYTLADQMHGREGLLAMGAVSGIAAYVLDKPVLQLEGIVGDSRFIEHVRNQDSLGSVLQEYHADYLIVSLANVRAESRHGCYLVTQPNADWAGPRTAKMSGEICAEPILHFFTPHGPNPWSNFPTMETLVWDLRGARWRTPTDQSADVNVTAE
jgi:hypothetical protein